MDKNLKVWYWQESTPSILPDDDTVNVVVIIPGNMWVLICNGRDLSNLLLTYPHSQFVSAARQLKYIVYPHVMLDMEAVSLDELMDVLTEMGFKLEIPETEPNWK